MVYISEDKNVGEKKMIVLGIIMTSSMAVMTVIGIAAIEVANRVIR